MALGTAALGPLMWDDPITENPALNAVEDWKIDNRHEHSHSIHLHIVQFQVLDRTNNNGNVRGPEPWETGFKDTFIAHPDEITRVRAKFDVPGLFNWPCHILEHEDKENDAALPRVAVAPSPARPHRTVREVLPAHPPPHEGMSVFIGT